MQKPPTDGERLLRLAAAFVDDILSMSDEEVLAEAAEDGIDSEAEATRLRATFERIVAQVPS